MATTVSDLIKRNKEYATGYQPMPYLSELTVPPSICVIACADPRCDPTDFFKVTANDLVVSLRSAGGRPTPVINDLLAIDTIIGFTNLVVVHHTDCGSTVFTTDSVKATLKARVPEKAAEIDVMEFSDEKDIMKSLKEDVALLKANPFIRPELAATTVGYLLDIKTGALTPLEN